jgi:photosystem II stability/assembly factor-like uncharacterized protein
VTRGAKTLILGTRKGLIVLERHGKGWRTLRHAHAGIPVPYAFVDARTRTLWASLDHGHWGQKLSRSKDLGRTWEEIAPPKYPKGAEVKKGKPATLKYIWVIAPGGADEKNRLYLGTQPGGLFASDDGGKGFELVRGLWNHPSRPEHWFGGGRDEPAIHSVLVDPRDSERVLVGISCAGVFETTDGGRRWQPRNRGLRADFLPDPAAEVGQDPHLLAWCAREPDALWQQNHCGIFKSRDGAASWTAVSAKGRGVAHFGFPIAVDERDAETAWVVPGISDERRMAVGGALCVARTENGGKTWKALRTGLPQRDAHDVVYRHALDLAQDALAFGSTTGNVYASSDRGDSWTVVGTNFPPVYSVRFAG